MPGHKCVYLHCSTKSGGQKTLFGFPKDRARSAIWAKASGREDLLQKTITYYKICEDHFEPKWVSLSSSGMKRLYNDALPSIFHSPKRSLDNVLEERPTKIIVLPGSEMARHISYCSVDDCCISSRDCIPFFRCPKDTTSCQQWKESLGFIGEHKYAKLTPDECNSRIKVCSLHFDDDCFTLSGKRLLKTAIPLKGRIKHVVSGNSADDGISNSLSYNPPEEPIRASQETSSSSGITLEGIFKFLDENYPQQATASIKEQLTLLDKTTKETTSAKPLKLDEQPNEVEVLVTDVVEPQIKVEEDELQDEDAEAPPSMAKDEIKTENVTDDEAVEAEPSPLEPEAHHPIQVFFDSMARTVMQFPPPLAVRAKVDVLQVISKLELEMWHNPPDPSTSTNFDQCYYFTQKPVTENIVTT